MENSEQAKPQNLSYQKTPKSLVLFPPHKKNELAVSRLLEEVQNALGQKYAQGRKDYKTKSPEKLYNTCHRTEGSLVLSDSSIKIQQVY